MAPTAPSLWGFGAQIVANPTDVFQYAALSFNRPPQQNINLPSQSQGPPATANGIGFNFTSEAAMDADFPSTTYTFTADRGFGPETGSLFMPDGYYTATIPHFTGTTYLGLQLFDPSQPFTGTINGFTPNPGANRAGIQIAVDKPATPGSPAARAWTQIPALSPSATSFTIPAGTLDPGTDYRISLYYGNSVVTEDAGFGGAADSVAGFTRVTSVAFTTVSEPPCEGLLRSNQELEEQVKQKNAEIQSLRQWLGVLE